MTHNFHYQSWLPFQNSIKSDKRSAPILYVIASRKYSKRALCQISYNPAKNLWIEMILQKEIYTVLQEWINSNESLKDTKIEKSNPLFRIVMHELHQAKIGFINKVTLKPDIPENDIIRNSKSKYFAMIWLPNNNKTGFNKEQYKKLIKAMNSCQYICKPLDKNALYISGPQYDDNEFNLNRLTSVCNVICDDGEMKLKYTVIVHEMAVDTPSEVIVPPNKQQSKQTSSAKTKSRKLTDINENTEIELNKQHHLMTKPIPTTDNKDEDDDGDGDGDDEEKKNLKEEKDDKEEYKDNSDDNYNISVSYSFQTTEIKYTERPMSRSRAVSAMKQHGSAYSAMISSYRSFAFMWIEVVQSKQAIISRQKTGMYPQKDVLPSYAVMKRLHKQPTEDPQVLYTIEMMGYDAVWNNLDLVVNRQFKWKDFLLLVLEFIFLPIFVLFPINYFLLGQKKNSMSPRFRPKSSSGIPWTDLDRTEQIPYDITVLWRDVPTTFVLKNEIIFRVSSFIISLIIIFVVYCGPFLYHVYNESIPERELAGISHVDKLQFFDCYGPLLLYILFIFTCIWWSTANRVLIGPKQHLLLYHNLYLHRPVASKHRELFRTDWAALVNLRTPMITTLFTFSYKKEFLLLQRPTDHLVDKILIWPLGNIKVFCRWLFIIALLLVYTGVENLENFEYAHFPFYISHGDKYWITLTIYNVFSSIVQCIFLFGFIMLWETMIFRIRGHLYNIQTLSKLMIRDTFTEYIDFDNVSNVLSWLELENFVKRKGMTLFSSIETPVLSLAAIAFISWGAAVYCVAEGIGLQLKTDNSIFSNAALWTWIYLGLLALFYTSRMLWQGRLYHKETIKQSRAIKRQCRTSNKKTLNYFLNKDILSMDEIITHEATELLLQHVEHAEIVPTVFGIQFDQLLAKAAVTAAISIIPTILSFVGQKLN